LTNFEISQKGKPYFAGKLENSLYSKIQRQLARQQKFIYQLGSTYALLGLNMATMFVLTPLLNKNLGQETYGVWLVLFNITNFFNLSSFGFGQTFTLELIKNQDKTKEVNKLVNTYLFSLLLFALGTFPLFLLFQFFLLGPVIKISPALLHEATRSFWLVYLIFFLNFISQVPFNILFARHKLSLRNGLEMGRVGLNFLTTFWVIQTGGGLVKISATTLLVTALYVISLFIFSKKTLVYQLDYNHFSKKQFRKFLKPSFHFFLLGVAMYVIVYSDGILVSSLKSAALVALYTVALRIPDTSMRLLFKIADVKTPKITTLYSQKNWAQLWMLHNRLFWLTFGAAALITLILLTLGPNLISLWMGKDFDLHYGLLVIFSINMLTQCLMHIPALFLISMGMHERSSILAMIFAPVSLVFAWLMSKNLGLEGIALAMCGSQFLVGIIAIPQFYSFMKEKSKESNFRFSWFVVR
jgi:O-antigen/teichoic acid export membrane protein